MILVCDPYRSAEVQRAAGKTAYFNTFAGLRRVNEFASANIDPYMTDAGGT